MLAFRKILGLAITARSIAVAEVGFARPRGRLVRAAEFIFPETVSLQEPAILGKALRQFLRQHHFAASRCVIGLDAGCLATKEKVLPPVPADALTGALTIAAEREFASDREDLLCDYVGPVNVPDGQAVLLVAASRRAVDQALAAARAAGLTVAAVAPSTMALAGATREVDAAGSGMLHLSPGGAELAWRSGRGFRMVRRLSAPVPQDGMPHPEAIRPWVDDLADEIRRVLALLPVGPDAPAIRQLLVWDGIGVGPDALDRLGTQLGLAVQGGRPLQDLGLDNGTGPAPDAKFAAPAALALAAFSKPSPFVDFLHSRLTPGRKAAAGRKVRWIALAAAVVAAAALLLFLDWRANRLAVDSLKGRLVAIDTPTAEAKRLLDQAAFARAWYDLRPRFLDCLRNVTLTFPVEGKIWATNLAVREDMRVSLSGKAVDESAVLEVLDRLKGSPGFTEVQPLYIRQAGGNARDVSFAINLRFVGAD